MPGENMAIAQIGILPPGWIVAAGYTAEFYEPGGTLTPKAVYTDDTAAVEIGSTVTFASSGLITVNGGMFWMKGKYRIIGKDASGNQAFDEDNVETMPSYNNDGWIDFGDTPTFVTYSAPTLTFTVPGDETANYSVGRRIKASGSTPFTVYGTILTSAFTSLTTVTVSIDSGTPNGTMNSVLLSIALNKNIAFENVAYPIIAGETGVTNLEYEYGNVKRFGAKGDGVTDDATAITNADTSASSADYPGQKLTFPPGTYLWSGTLTPSQGVDWIGGGHSQFSTKLLAADSTATINWISQSNIENFEIQGSSNTPGAYVGTAVTMNTSLARMRNCMIRYFQTGIRAAGGFWQTLEDVRLNYNRINLDFNAADSASVTNALSIVRCYIHDAERGGIASTYTPIRNININFYGGSIENNSTVSPATYPQIALGSCGHFAFYGVYIESTLATKPDAINLNSSGDGVFFNCYFNGADTIAKATDSASNIVFISCRFLSSVTADIDIATTSGGVYAISCNTGNTVTIGGDDSGEITSKIAEMPKEHKTFTPTVVGASTAGTQTYSLQKGYYTQIGNMLFFNGIVTMTAKDGATAGGIYIGGVPSSSANISGNVSICSVAMDNTTLAGTSSHFYGRVPANSARIELYEANNAAGAAVAVVAADITATTSIEFSGVIQLAAGS